MKSKPEADAVLATYATGTYVAFATAMPLLDGSNVAAVEVTGPGYQRQLLQLGAAHDYTDDDDRDVRRRLSSVELLYTVGGLWSGNLTHVLLMSAPTGGALRRVLPLPLAIPQPSFGVVRIPAGQIEIHEA